MEKIKRVSVTEKEVLHAIPGSKGLIVNIENTLWCTRDAVKAAIEKYPRLQKEMEDEAEREKEQILHNLMEDAKAGDKAARELYLKAQAKDRGFGEQKSETNVTNQVLVYLHAPSVDLIPNSQNGNASKMARIESWQQRAEAYHQKQIAEVESKSVDELLAIGNTKTKKRVAK